MSKMKQTIMTGKDIIDRGDREILDTYIHEIKNNN